MRLLIDGDILVYRAGFAIQSKDNRIWENDDTFSYPPVSHALQATKMMVNNILNSCRHDAVTIYLSSDDKTNFRFEVAKTKPYKGNRKAPKPLYYHEIREYLIKRYDAQVVSGQEADDAMAQASDTKQTVIVTIDKDLDMVPGWHYNFVKKKKYYVSRTKAYRHFCKQMLVGDSVDNIPGVRGVGPVKAEKILKLARRDKELMLQLVYNEYATDEEFLEMGNLLWIRREEGKPWLPELRILQQNKRAYSTGGVPDSKKE